LKILVLTLDYSYNVEANLSGRPVLGRNSTIQRLREQNMRLNLNRILLSIFLVSLILNSDLYGVSLSTETIEKLKKEGKLEEWVKRANLAREKGVWQPNPNPPIKLGKGNALLPDTIKPIVICVDFSDKAHSHDTGEFSLLLFSKDFAFPTGSMRDFYLQNSYEKLDVVGGVTGWYRMPQPYSYYVWGQNGLCISCYPHNAQKLAEDAVNAADPYVNFADYDYNHDGWVDALIIVYAGSGAEETGSDDDIWSHSGYMSLTFNKDGVKLHEYIMGSETSGSGLTKIGVFAHEFGHILGLPDLYDNDYTSEGLGNWSVMARGSWNNEGETPAHFDAWCKYKLGFSQVDRLRENRTNVEILKAETSPISYRLWNLGGGGTQYFLVENRQKTGFDKYLPGEGLLIYHVDEIWSNNNEWCPGDTAIPHYKVALEQADGEFGLEGCYGSTNRGDGGDPFPGWDNKRAFEDTTTPSSRNYYNSPTRVAVWNVSDSDSFMHANMDIAWSRPCLYLDEFTFDDSPPGGDGDSRAEAGETVKLLLTISNIWLPLNGATVTAYTDTSGINFTHPTSNLGDIGTDGSANNHSDPIVFEVDPHFSGRPTIFTLQVQGNTTYGVYILDFNAEAWAGNAKILLVDDDSGSATDYQSYYTSALDSLRKIYDIWDTQAKTNPDFSFSKYKYLIWYTGDHRTNLFTPVQVESLMSFLDRGGRLFLTSQDAAEALYGSPNPLLQEFLTDYLHCSLRDTNCTQRLIMGESGDTVGDTLYIQAYGVGSAQNQSSKDVLLPDSLATTVLKYAKSWWNPVDSVAGIRYQGNYKLLFFGFGFEGMNPSEQEYQGQYLSNPHFVMQRVLNWLEGYTDVFDSEEEYINVPKSIKLFQNYPNPFNASTIIMFELREESKELKVPYPTKIIDRFFTPLQSESPATHASLKIYNILGQLVKTLFEGDLPAGGYEVMWDGKDESGAQVASGAYLYRLKTGQATITRKMILLK
jgi:M6 family metalloprotease-like protein